MVQVIICTHEQMAIGVKKTAEFIMGPQENLHAIAAYTKEQVDYEHEITTFLQKHPTEPVVVLTDIVGGSVNTALAKMIPTHKNLQLIAGVNLPMVVQLLLSNEQDLEATIAKAIREAKNGIQDINQTIKTETETISDDF